MAGIIIAYYPTLLDAQNNTNVITTPTAYTNVIPAVQTLGVVVTTPAGCKSITTLDIRVLPIPTPKNPSTATPELVLPKQCENALGSGVATVNLTTFQNYIINGDPNISLYYFPTQADLDNNTNQILDPTVALVGDPTLVGSPINLVQYVYISVSSNVYTDYTGRKCYREVQQGFIVNPLPKVAPIADYQKCESPPLNQIEQFDLTLQISDLLAGNITTPTSNYSVAFYENATLTAPINNPSAYNNTSTPQTIYVVITNTTTGCQSQVGQFNIKVNPKPLTALQMPPMNQCDYDGTNDGLMLFTQNPNSALPSLAGYVNDILGPTQTAPTFVVEFYDNLADATAGNAANALTNLATYQVHTGTYYVRVVNTLTGCDAITSFAVVIEKLAEPVITTNTGSNIACVNWNSTTVINGLTLNSGVSDVDYSFAWFADTVLIAGATTSTYPITSMTQSQVIYSVIATSKNPPLFGCVSVEIFYPVIRSGQAANVTYTVTNAFADNQIITVTNDGFGIYEYSLDDGPRQTSNVFTNVSLGDHTIYVWDVTNPNYSCGVQVVEHVQIIDYPHYFTPNGDGIHDTWNIVGLVTSQT